MNLKEMLKLADEIVFAKTGQHLDDLQEAVLRGTLQRETYKQIAKSFDCSESSVRKVGAELWEILSAELGEEVSKSNVCSVIHRFKGYNNVSNFAQNKIAIANFNICGEATQQPDLPNSHRPNEETVNKKQPETLHHDLSEMPELGVFYSRTRELDTLTTWMIQQRCRLIALTGICGIGKTSLAVQLVEQIKDDFEYVIWRTIDASHSLEEFQHELIQFFLQSEKLDSSATNRKHLPLIKYLQKYRCLIILDDVHHLFCSGELAGKYKPEHEEYRSFLKQIEKLSHQSCFLLIGWEQPRELTQITCENSPIQTLQLMGLDVESTVQIFKDDGLREIDHYSMLIQGYQGNPFWLKSVANIIQDLGISIPDLLQNDTLFLAEDLKDVLEQQLSRLSAQENVVMSLLAKEIEPINLVNLAENSEVMLSNLFNVIQSLLRRCLIQQEGSFYFLQPVLREYIRTKL
ncbi:NB-ARC domain-containing protein [Oscillatoria sp. HE19RPO]|uniref:NB-ARC domain-containing protein n=1 Tax=Oscillatoria sp. HE19RPO TaxID=2954806 RepID=UPI0020C27B2C|nr:NB-ARC domain-containing protein [Oscillatoria sp. HE19RPO]